MRIIRITLTNFLGLNREIDFSPEFNVVIGVNGSGKTRVLNAIRFLLYDLLPRFAMAPPAHRFLRKSSISVNEISFFSDFMAAELIFESIDGVIFRYEVSHSRILGSEGREKDSVNLVNFGGLTPNQGGSYFVERRNSINQPLALYYSVKRGGSEYKTIGFAKQNYNNGYFQCLSASGNMFSGISVWWRNQVEIGVRYQLDAVKMAMRTIFPEILDWYISDDQLYVRKIIKTPRLNSQTGESYQEVGEFDFRFEELSHGEQTMALFGLDIARRLAQLNPIDSNPIANGRGVVLIDEIDLHLHPKWQREVIERLRKAFPALQFICTTHSPFIIQSQHVGVLIRLDEDNGEEVSAAQFHPQSIEDIVEEVQGVKLPQKSQRYWNMMEAAEKYYSLLRQGQHETGSRLAELKIRLDELSAPFSDDPAFQALLKQERIFVLGSEK